MQILYTSRRMELWKNKLIQNDTHINDRNETHVKWIWDKFRNLWAMQVFQQIELEQQQ